MSLRLKRQRRQNLCGTTLVPDGSGTFFYAISGAARCSLLNISVHSSEGIPAGLCLPSSHLTDGSLKVSCRKTCPRLRLHMEGIFTSYRRRSSGRTADSGWQTCWWWTHGRDGGEQPWERSPLRCQPVLPHSKQFLRQRTWALQQREQLQVRREQRKSWLP